MGGGRYREIKNQNQNQKPETRNQKLETRRTKDARVGGLFWFLVSGFWFGFLVGFLALSFSCWCWFLVYTKRPAISGLAGPSRSVDSHQRAFESNRPDVLCPSQRSRRVDSRKEASASQRLELHRRSLRPPAPLTSAMKHPARQGPSI